MRDALHSRSAATDDERSCFLSTDERSSVWEGPMVEPTGVRLSRDEVAPFQEFLEGILKYHPEGRCTTRQAVEIISGFGFLERRLVRCPLRGLEKLNTFQPVR